MLYKRQYRKAFSEERLAGKQLKPQLAIGEDVEGFCALGSSLAFIKSQLDTEKLPMSQLTSLNPSFPHQTFNTLGIFTKGFSKSEMRNQDLSQFFSLRV